ncbi:glycosyltransferase [Occultella aeris]|uniref:GDP-mannose-dependent alpha-(1-6)-phosphatidylinositol monomannoside mannosyltransferase n=1 Tax=Occultella aeris TaxID=2761496 RepID=A0A7M4DDL6_9MICO|nr:glycosyltransferase [Occultella aeris]VZO34935.1 GDP-mannose-dependent alpha-(1-6)-phosphatidylinositol monomannoside mannosyltransferase [Occultella aeris]
MFPPEPRIGYVLKMYPRFSETFIVTEMLALEERGADLEIFSLRPPADGRFHEALARVAAPVTYLPHHLRAVEVWRVLSAARPVLPELAQHLDELLAAAPDDAAAAVELAAQVRRRRITHLHAHFGSVSTTVARLAARIAGIGYSFTAHAKDIFHADVDPADLTRKLTDAAFVITVSDYNLTHLRREYGTAAAGVIRLYNGLDLDTFAYRVTPPDARTDPVIVGVGRLVEKKGFVHLVDALALLARRGSPVRLELVGTGPEEAALRAQVIARGLAGRVTFHGPLPQGRMADVVSRAAVFAAPCVIGSDGNRDGLPTVVLEALALGTPVVATPVTGMPEAVRDAETGLLVPEADPVALANALERVLTDPDSARERASTGRLLVEDLFDSRRNAAALHALYAGTAVRTPDQMSPPAPARPAIRAHELAEVAR